MFGSPLVRIAAGAVIAALTMVGAIALPAAAAPSVVAVTGQVLLAPTYTPAPAGSVSVTWQTAADGPESAPALVDADGRFAFSLPAGSYNFRYVYTGSAGDYAELAFIRRGATPIAVSGSATTIPTQTMYLRGSINGQVLLGAADKLPAGAGEVRVTPTLETASGDTVLTDKAVLTDATGHFSITGMSSNLYTLELKAVATPVPYQTSTVDASFHVGALYVVATTKTLPKLGSVSGHVYLSDTAHPATAGQITVTPIETPACTSGCPTAAHTDADGAYTIPEIPEGTWHVEFTAATPSQYSPVDSETMTVSADVTGIDATMQLTPTITGRVTDTTGAPVAGVYVAADGHDPADASHEAFQSGTTDADGRYVIYRLTSGYRYTVSFQKPDYVTQSWPDTAWPVAQVFSLGAHEVRPGIDETLYRPAIASGVLSMASYPASRPTGDSDAVDVLRLDHSTGAWQKLSIAGSAPWTGQWTLSLLPGTYKFQAVYTGTRGISTVMSAPVTLAEGGHTTFSPRFGSFKRDFTGDFKPDVLVRNRAGQLFVYPSNGSGSFLKSKVVGTGWNGLSMLFNAGSFADPYDDDIVGRSAQGVLTLYYGRDGGFLPSETDQIGSGWNGLNLVFSPGDFNGDGDPDIMARTPAGDLLLYRGNGIGGWRGQPIRVGTGWKSFTSIFAVGDMNEDGFADVAARDATGTLWLYPGNGSGGWKPRVRLGTGWGAGVALFSVGDFDGDRAPDILARDTAGKLWIYPGNGAGGLLPRRQIGIGWNGLTFVN